MSSLKAIRGWTNKDFTKLFELLKDMLPEVTYDANDDILYRNEFEQLHYCLRVIVRTTKSRFVNLVEMMTTQRVLL